MLLLDSNLGATVASSPAVSNGAKSLTLTFDLTGANGSGAPSTTPAGAFTLEATLDGNSWYTLSEATAPLAAFAVGNAEAHVMVLFRDLAVSAARVVYTRASGGGGSGPGAARAIVKAVWS